MPAGSRLRSVRALLAPAVLLVALGLAGCTEGPADVPGSVVEQAPRSTPTPTTPPSETGSTVVPADGGATTRLITNCLARYGLNERPAVPDETVEAQDRAEAQRLLDVYDETFLNCSAEALSTDAPVTTPAS